MGPEHPRTLAALIDQTKALLANGKAAEAEEVLKPNLPLFGKVLGQDHPTTRDARDLLARVVDLKRQDEQSPLDPSVRIH